MGSKLKRRLIEQMRCVRHMLQDTPPCVDGAKRWLVLPGEMIDLASYGQRLQKAFASEDETDARHLLKAIL